MKLSVPTGTRVLITPTQGYEGKILLSRGSAVRIDRVKDTEVPDVYNSTPERSRTLHVTFLGEEYDAYSTNEN